MPIAASSDSSSSAALALTELHASTWEQEGHEVLLHAALRGGDDSSLYT